MLKFIFAWIVVVSIAMDCDASYALSLQQLEDCSAVLPSSPKPTESNRVAKDSELLCRMPGAGPQETPLKDEYSKTPLSFNLLVWNLFKAQRVGMEQDYLHLAHLADVVLIQETHVTDEWQNILPSSSSDMQMVVGNSFFDTENIATGVALGSRLPILDAFALRSPVTEPFVNTPKLAIAAYVDIGPGRTPLLIVNAHMINFVTQSAYQQHVDQIASILKKHNGPILFAGDLNTWSNARVASLEALAKQVGLVEAKPVHDDRTMHLDHIFARGLDVTYVHIRSDINSSDHWPLQAHLVIRD